MVHSLRRIFGVVFGFAIVVAYSLLISQISHADTAKGNTATDAALDGIGGAAINYAAQEGAKLALDEVGLASVADALFPDPEKIDYERIAQIVGSEVRKANKEQTIYEQAGLVRGVAITVHGLKNQWNAERIKNRKRANEKVEPGMNELLRELDRILGTVSHPDIKNMGLGTYLGAAQLKVNIELFLWKTVGAKDSGYKARIDGDIKSMKMHINRVLFNIREIYFMSIKCIDGGQKFWQKRGNFTLAVTSPEYFELGWTHDRSYCSAMKDAQYRLIYYNRENETVCDRRYGRDSHWYIFQTRRTNFTNKQEIDSHFPTADRFESRESCIQGRQQMIYNALIVQGMFNRHARYVKPIIDAWDDILKGT